MTAGLYPMTAGWLSSYNQSQVIAQAQTQLERADAHAGDAQLQHARAYNDALTSGVRLESGGNVPVGAGNLSGTELRYDQMLAAGQNGLMGRVKIPSIDVDLPIYHGTSDETLLRGAGHLEGSHLPIGGLGTRSVITAHRGLANSTMFTNLDQVGKGDTFTLEVLDEVLVYRVFDVQIIAPDDTESLRATPGADVVTLVTCTPLGINSHRILVTGERVLPTPMAAVENAGRAPDVPGFPWWILLGSGGVLLAGGYLAHRGFVDARLAAQIATEHGTPAEHADEPGDDGPRLIRTSTA